MSNWTKRIAILVISLMAIVTADDSQREMPDQPLVELIISDYLKEEQRLWYTIQSRGDNALLQVFNTHERFLGKMLSETDVGIVSKNPKSPISISENANAINETVEMGYTHLRDKDLERGIITAFAVSSLHVLVNVDSFYEAVNKEDFWQNIQDVRFVLSVSLKFALKTVLFTSMRQLNHLFCLFYLFIFPIGTDKPYS